MKLSNEHPAHPEWVDPFDRSYVKSMAQAILSPPTAIFTRKCKFRYLTVASEPRKALLFASNHSGMAFPWDAIVFESLA